MEDKQIMGHRKTFERIPGGRLPKRIHYWMLHQRTLDRLNWIRTLNGYDRANTRWMVINTDAHYSVLGRPKGTLPA